MKRTLGRIVLISIVIVLSVGGIAWAQEDDVSVEGLADGLSTLTETVTGLVSRVERIESLWSGPGAIDVEGGCVIGMPDHLQDETVLKYKEQFDEWLDTDSVWPVEIKHEPDTGHTVIVYADDIGMFADYLVAESWSGCDFVGSTDWYESDQ